MPKTKIGQPPDPTRVPECKPGERRCPCGCMRVIPAARLAEIDALYPRLESRGQRLTVTGK